MKYLNVQMMQNLSFPDYEIERMEFSPQEKRLTIYIEGAWLDENGGTRLGKGKLFFNNWDSLLINRFNSIRETWSAVDELSAEPLRNLCEFKFYNDTVFLSGFGKTLGQWMEWKIVNAKMHAEFEFS